MKQFFIKYEYTKNIHGEEDFRASDSVRIKAHTAKEAATIFKNEHKKLNELEIVDVHEFQKRTNEFKKEMNFIASKLSNLKLDEEIETLEEEFATEVEIREETEESINAKKLDNEVHDIIESASLTNDLEVESEVNLEEYNEVMVEIESSNEIDVNEETPVFEEEVKEVSSSVESETSTPEAAPIVEEEIEAPIIEDSKEEIQTPIVEEVKEDETTPVVEELEQEPIIEEDVTEEKMSSNFEDVAKELLFNSELEFKVENNNGQNTLLVKYQSSNILSTQITEELKSKLN